MWLTRVRCIRKGADGTAAVIGESCHGSQYGTYDGTAEMARMFNRLVAPLGYPGVTREDLESHGDSFSTPDGRYAVETETVPNI